ncbi:MAG: hypothetical protein U0234_00605 [Sandaracinus sp.]
MTIHDQIRRRIEAFSQELEALVRSAAIEAVRTSLGGASAPAAQPVARAASSVRQTPSTKAPLTFKRKKGAKRTPEQLAKIDDAILGFVKTNPGQGVEHMAKSLGVSSNDLKLRVSLLLDGKKIKKTGVKRATKYFPA